MSDIQAALIAPQVTHHGDRAGQPLPASIRPARPTCNRCGFEVPPRLMGCKNPCRNCGTVYPLGDCSD